MTCTPEGRARVRLVAALALMLTAPALLGSRDDAAAALARAAVAYNAGKLGVARVEVQNAVQTDPDWATAQVMRTRVLLALGDGTGAAAALQRAEADGAPADDLLHLRAHAALLMGEPHRALDYAADVPARFAAYAARIRGRAQTVLGDYAEASTEFDAAVALAPRDAVVWADLGRFRMMAGNIAGAIGAADRAVAIAPASPEVLLLKGELVRIQYGLVAAIPWFERALAIDPENVPVMIEAAATLGEAGRMRDMLAMTRRILKAEPGNPAGFYLQAVLAARAQHFDLARRLLQRTGDALAELPGAMLLGATLDMEAGNFEQAIATLQRLRTLQPENRRVLQLLGTAMWRAGDDRGAITTLAPLAESEDPGAYTLSVIGRAQENAGDGLAAASWLDRAAARRAVDRSLPPPVLDGDVLFADGRFAGAVASYRSAASINFSEPLALRLIEAFRRAGDSAAADRTVRLFLAQNPRSVMMLLHATEALEQRGNWRAAITILEGVRLRSGDRDARIHVALARNWLMAGDKRKAMAAAGRAYALLPSSAEAAASYGWVTLQAMGDARKAVELLEKAAALAPDDAAIRERLGQARTAAASNS